jgi:hypothetical protein
MKLSVLLAEFVEFVPPELEEGKFYVSIEYATSVHLCACGCGNKVVTPISPAEWQLIWDGDTVSLFPSIGNWEFPCRSHYWVRRNEIRWAREWTPRKIEEGRQNDAADLARYWAGRLEEIQETAAAPEPQPHRRSMVTRIRRYFRI